MTLWYNYRQKLAPPLDCSVTAGKSWQSFSLAVASASMEYSDNLIMDNESMSEKLPERIARLDELANNLWWSWHTQARDLFRSLDYPLWITCGHNPVKQLREIGADKLQVAANDPSLLALYDSVMAA